MHLASPYCVEGCLERYGDYHITICRQKKMPKDCLANPVTALKRIKKKFAKPVKTRLRIWNVSRSCVARVHLEGPLFKSEIGALRFPRAHYGGHDCWDLTISM